MITLSILKTSGGTVKKMLHVPTLQLYVSKEESITNKEMRRNLKDWLQFWQLKLSSSDLHVKVLNSFWNTPEGCISIVYEYLDGLSLENLLESIGTLSEGAIREIAQKMIIALDDIHQFGNYHGMIVPSQILFSQKNGSIKLNLGLSYRAKSLKDNCFFAQSLKNVERQSLYEPSSYNNVLHKRNNSLVVEKDILCMQKKDVFNFGLVLLSCAIGNLDFLEFSLDQFNQQDQICCPLHAQAAGKQLFQLKTFFNKSNFSSQFTDFICSCLRFDNNHRLTTKQLAMHSFLTTSSLSPSPSITFHEILLTQTLIYETEKSQLPKEHCAQSTAQLKRMGEAIHAVLINNCENWFSRNVAKNMKQLQKIIEMDQNSEIVNEISRELGLDREEVFSVLKGVIQDVPYISAYRSQTKR